MALDDQATQGLTRIGTAPYTRRGLVGRGAVLGVGAAASLSTVSKSAAQDEPIELTLLDHQAPRIALLEEMLPRFEEEMAAQGKNITVNLQEAPAPDTEFQTKLTLDFSSGNAPDVTSFGGTLTADFAAAGYLLDLTDLASEWPDWEDHFYERLRGEQIQVDGRMYSIPREASIIQLFYRRDVLEDLNVSTEQPMSWQELLDRMTTVTEQTGNPSLLIPAGEAWVEEPFSRASFT